MYCPVLCCFSIAVEKTPGPSCGIFSKDLSTGAPPFSHIVFVLDASFSMAGNPFRELRAAFAEFIETRLGVRGSGQGMSGAEKDVVTVLKFGATVEVVYTREPLRSARVDLGDREGSGRGVLDSTDFKNALQQAHYQVPQQVAGSCRVGRRSASRAVSVHTH
jgi:hypothetical protein